VEDLAILAGKYPSLHAVKEATGNLDRMRKTHQMCGPDFQIMSGDDDITHKIMVDAAIQATGVISVISNVVPAAVEKMTRAILGGNMGEADRLLNALSPLFGIVTVKAENDRQLPNGQTVKVIDKFRNPQAIKTLMNGLGMAAGPCRQPLGKMTKSGVDIVRNAARETHRRDPSILKPIEHAYRVKIQKRLDDDSIWSALVY
jgi:4-hydroxy-tetrahydrodipicolinate synthase